MPAMTGDERLAGPFIWPFFVWVACVFWLEFGFTTVFGLSGNFLDAGLKCDKSTGAIRDELCLLMVRVTSAQRRSSSGLALFLGADPALF